MSLKSATRLKTPDNSGPSIPIRTEFQQHSIPRQDLNVMDPHFTGEMSKHHLIGSNAYPEGCRRQSFFYSSLKHLKVLIWHVRINMTKSSDKVNPAPL